MRALLAVALLAPLALAQDAAAPPPAPAPAAEVPQLSPPDPLPGLPLPKDATWQTTPTGLRWVTLAKGDEAAGTPTADSVVTVFYTAYLESGTKVDECAPGGTPASFPLRAMIKGWTEGLQFVHPGGKIKLHVPWQLAYGERGSKPKIPAFANMIFDVELVSFVAMPTFSLPADADLKSTASGLKYQVVKEGTGRVPQPTDTVSVNYMGWLTDGTPFDSSYKRGKPASFKVGQVIKGWTEGLQLMEEGAIYKFVIPPGLAYGEKGAGGIIPPHATLVFQVELVKIGG